jgi:antitoxin component YwqK of YwqJK toxin-antitoxin module
MKLERYILLALVLNLYAIIGAQQEIVGNGYNILYYSNGKVSSEGMMKNSKPDGYWKTYYLTGVLKSEGNRKNHILDSTWVFYNNVGDTVRKINYIMGKRTGYMLTYNTDRTANIEYVGNIIARELYINDEKEGTSYYYYNSGRLKSKAVYKDNKRDGTAFEYDESGTIITILYYIKGNLAEREKINRVDEQGLKQGVWKEFYADDKVKKEINYTDDKFNGLYKEYDESGNLSLILKYEGGKIVEDNNIGAEDIDIKNEYDESGNLTYNGAFRNFKPIGIHRKYDISGNVINAVIYNDNGVKISEGIVDREGNKSGNWKNFYATGILKSKGQYRDNLQQGKWVFYFTDGKIEQTGEFENGRFNGEWVWYYENETVKRKEEYYEGREEGDFIEYDEKGEVITKGKYFDGEKEGEWYYNVGDEIEIGSYIGGLKDGKWRNYYTGDILKFEGDYIQGNPDGKHRYYYENGILKEEQYFTMGIKEKSWKKYDRYGNLLITVTYDNNREIRINGVKVDFPDENIKLIK